MAERNVILCVGSRKDTHITEVQAYLRGINSDLKLILFNPLCVNHFIDITVTNDSTSCVITTGENQTVAESVRAVWYLWHPRKFSDGDSFDGAFIAKDFALEEWNNVMQSLQMFLPRAIWMNKMRNVQQIRSKAYQLYLAQACGLNIPMTKITNDPVSVQGLFSLRGANNSSIRLISKPLTSLFIPPNKKVRPMEITSEYVSHASSNISIFPGVFQEIIERDVDLCVTVVGEQLFPARVHPKRSFGTPQTSSDIQRFGACKIPEYVENCILNFHRKAGLVFAVYDLLMITERKEVVFIDCNPCGSWLALEYSTGLQITRAVAEKLAAIGLVEK